MIRTQMLSQADYEKALKLRNTPTTTTFNFKTSPTPLRTKIELVVPTQINLVPEPIHLKNVESFAPSKIVQKSLPSSTNGFKFRLFQLDHKQMIRYEVIYKTLL